MAQSTNSYWPGQKWRTATPESQGIDSKALATAVDTVIQNKLGVHSLLVIRHGHAVLDTYFYPYNASVPHDLASVTKSITSTLTGVAVGQGLIKLDQKLLSFFPNELPATIEDQKKNITVGNMLRMESGLDCGVAPGERELEAMKRAPNWVQFALSIPMKYAPGERTSYCSPGYHLLGSIIGTAAKSTELEFANKNLFGPLGIRDVVWASDPQGRNNGWGDSHLYPQDVAKIGYLYLHGGEWNDKQIVPKDWVTMSITPPTVERGMGGSLGYEWGATNGANGRQYGGTGRGGQSLIVLPDLDTIIVITAGGNGGQIANLVRQAIKPEALPANAEGVALLQAKVVEAANVPAATPAPELPAIAAKISGAMFEFPVNTSRLDNLTLTFNKKEEAEIAFRYQGQNLRVPIGLDGRYHLGPHGPFKLLAGAKGSWTAENEFSLDLNFIANINRYTMKLKFDGDQVEMTVDESSGLIRNGKVTGKKRI